VTYELASRSPDIRVRIDTEHPDLRIQLVDDVESADFALVDDVGVDNACGAAGAVRTVALVDRDSIAEIRISLSRQGGDSDLRLYVHSARFGHREAGALLAAMRREQDRIALAQAR
jgi:hypothetical protein